jgi:hypothetical protein
MDESARKLSVSRAARCIRFRNRGVIRSIHIGKSARVPVLALDDYVRRQLAGEM